MIEIVAVGRMKEKTLRTQIEEYEKRLRPLAKLEIIEMNDEVVPRSNSDSQDSQVKGKEGERILAKIKEQEYVILLDLWREMVDSERSSKKLDQLQTYQTSNLTFVITGSLRPGENVYDRYNWEWKLSDLIFTHRMTRVFVLEQIYHAFIIQDNNPYHKQCTEIIPAPPSSKMNIKQEHPQRFRTTSAFFMEIHG